MFEYENAGYLSFIISDQDKFEKLDLVDENLNKTEVNGMKAYESDGNGNANIIVDGKKAWLCLSKDDISDQADAVKTFSSLKKDDSVTSINGFADNMGGGDIDVFINVEELMAVGGGIAEQQMNRELSRYGVSTSDLNLKDVYNSRVFISTSFEKDKMTVKAKCLDEEGNNVLAKIMGDSTIDTDMLKHFDKSTTLVYATVLPEYAKKMYSKMISGSVYDEVQKGIIEEIFKNLDDNVAIGISLSGQLKTTYTNLWGDTSVDFNKKSVGVTLVAKCKKDLSGEIATLASFMGKDIASDGSVTVPVDNDITIRVKADGKYVVISNREAPAQPLADPGVFKGKHAAMFVNLSKSSPASLSIREAFGISLDLTAVSYSDKQDSVFELKANDNKKDNVLAYLIDLVMQVSKI